MIEKIKLGSVNKQYAPQQNGKGKLSQNHQPSFGGIGSGLISAVQLCEKHPMVNVSVLDLSTAIVPRTIIETYAGSEKKDANGNTIKDAQGKTVREPNVYAGMEAFRRESSGLIVNCLIPSFIVLGLANMFKKPIMGGFNKSNLSNTWANSDSIDKISEYYKDAQGSGRDKVYNTFKNMFNDIEGLDGDVGKGGMKKFKDIFKNDPEFKKALDKLTDAAMSDKPDKKHIKEAYETIVGKAHISEHFKFGKDKAFFSNNLEAVCNDSTKFLHGIVKEGITDADKLADYAKRAKKLVNVKSLAGLGVIIPLALSMQPINRWITRKTSGKKGAPIYNDFKDRKEDAELSATEKAALLKQKFISVGSMVGVALLSMMKWPNMSMFQFKGLFPSMDQARLISTATFASRMAAAEDKNELREATVRDIATFSSFYFLGDYAAKAIATGIEASDKTGKVKLLNRLKNPKEGANAAQKFWNWVKHTSLKSTDELATAKDKKLRTICQIGNLAFSLISLGIFIPLYTRTQTNKKRQEELAAKLKADQQTALNNTVQSSFKNASGGAGTQAAQETSAAANTLASSSSSADEFAKSIVKESSPTFKAFFNS